MRRFRHLFPVLLCATLAAEPADPPAPSPERLAQVNAALARTPDSVPLLSERGDARLFRGDFAGAVADFEKTIALDPAQDAPHWRLGIAYYFKGEWEKSSRQFAKYHAYDGHDRENGVWKFLADAQAHGLEAARRTMLAYREFDREPFPSLYEMLAGRMTPEAFAGELQRKGLASRRGVQFFALYYGGLYDELQGRHEEALAKVRAAVGQFGEEAAGEGGPAYMWQVARVHLRKLEEAGQAPPR